MKNTPLEKTENNPLNVMLPEALMERTRSFCAKKNITIQEFVTDAIIEKLALVYKERGIKQRL
jgi:hypothetical protein